MNLTKAEYPATPRPTGVEDFTYSESRHVNHSAERSLGDHSVENSAGIPEVTLARPSVGTSQPNAAIFTTNDTVASSGASFPVVAGDDDVIEKEWVDLLKDIVKNTHGDPYVREKQVKQAQIDYLKKRFGRSVGNSSD